MVVVVKLTSSVQMAYFFNEFCFDQDKSISINYKFLPL